MLLEAPLHSHCAPSEWLQCHVCLHCRSSQPPAPAPRDGTRSATIEQGLTVALICGGASSAFPPGQAMGSQAKKFSWETLPDTSRVLIAALDRRPGKLQAGGDSADTRVCCHGRRRGAGGAQHPCFAPPGQPGAYLKMSFGAFHSLVSMLFPL